MNGNPQNHRIQKCLSESPEKQTDNNLHAKKNSIIGSSTTSLNSKDNNNYKFSNSDLYDYTNEAYKTPESTNKVDDVFDQVIKPDEIFDGFLFDDQKNANQTLKILNALRKNRQLCDLILQLDDDTTDIYCHQFILACNSKFFMEIFTNYELELSAYKTSDDSTENEDTNVDNNQLKLNQIRKKSLQTIVNKNLNSTQRQLVFCLSDYLKHFLKDTNHHHLAKLNSAVNHNSPYHHYYNHKNKNIDPVSSANDEKNHQFNLNMDYEALKACIDFMYTSKLKIPSYLIPHVYTLAYHLSFDKIVAACAQHLTKLLCVDNCLSIRGFALDEQLIQASTQCIEKNIEYILELNPRSASVSSLTQQENQDYQSPINLAHKEFNNLPRIVIELVGIQPKRAKLPDNIVNLTQMCMNWLVEQLCAKSDHDLNYLCDNLSMLYMDSKDHMLHDCCDMDASDTNFTDHINDYKKLHSCTNGSSSPTSQKPFQNGTRLKTFKITDQELNAIGTATPIKFKILHDNEIICTYQVSDHSFITICTLTGKLVTLNVHLVSTNEHSSDSDCRPDLRSDSKTSLNETDLHSLDTPNRVLTNGFEFERLAKMRLARCSHGVIAYEHKLYIIGGYERGECLNLCEVYDPQTNTIEEISPMEHRRGRAAVTHLEKTKSIYVMGGSNGHEDLNSIETYDLEKKVWKLTKFDLELGFTNLAAIGCDKYIYLVGLKGDPNRSRTCCLRYEPETNEFTRMAELNYGRSQSALVWTTVPSKLDENKTEFVLYVFGGYDSMRCLASCEIYNVIEDKWSTFGNMHEPRRGAGAAIHKKTQTIYIVGGTNGSQSLKTIEIYDTKNKKWSIGPDLNIARNNVTIEFVGDILFAIGGFDGKSFLKTIEYLDCNNLNDGWSMYHKQNNFEFLKQK